MSPDWTILEVMEHPDILGPFFQGETWGAWRAFLAALFGLPMGEKSLELYRQHTGRTTPPTFPFKEAAIACGRRGGKSRILALIAVYLAVYRDYSPHLAPGEVATIPVLAADRKQARSIFRFVLGMLDAVEFMREMIVGEPAVESVVLNNNVVIEITTASFRATRGYTYACALCDEIAFWRSDESANPDSEIIAAMRPGMSTIPGAMLLIGSSPYAKRGLLWKTFKLHYGQDDARVLVWKASTREMNPTIDQAIIDEAMEEDAAAASSEFLGEFRNDLESYVPIEVVEACTAPGRYELPPLSGIAYRGYVDPSGGSVDSMTLAVAHLDKDRRVVIDAVREVKPPFSPEGTVADFCALLKTYRISAVTGDRYAGEWPREQFRKHDIKYNISEKVRSDLYRDLLPILNSGKIELLDIKRLSAQLIGLERRTARGGRDSIDHAPGAHDDVAVAVAGVASIALATRPKLRITAEAVERIGAFDPHNPYSLRNYGYRANGW